MGRFKGTTTAPPIEVFLQNTKCVEDPTPNKVNLTVGAYRTEEGQPWVLPVVKSAEQQIAHDETLNHEYLPITGLKAFSNKAKEILLGASSPAIKEGRVGGCQGLGGTGSLYVGLAYLREQIGCSIAYVSDPTWGNHISICKRLGYEVRKYRYWDQKSRSIDFDGFTQDLLPKNESEKGKTVVLLHAIAHNPTGMDPSHDQWRKIADIVEEQKIFPFFDIAYQGFATGDLDGDAWAPRYFINERGMESFIAQSFSKNFGLYNERVGHLCYVVDDAAEIEPMDSHVKSIVRQTYSNPPNHGGRVVATVLNNPSLFAEWKQNVSTMADRIKLMRQQLHQKLTALGTPGNWDHVVRQNGMFSFTGLNKDQVKYIEQEHHIYMLSSGRINMCGLNMKNIDLVAKAINDAVTKIQ